MPELIKQPCLPLSYFAIQSAFRQHPSFPRNLHLEHAKYAKHSQVYATGRSSWASTQPSCEYGLPHFHQQVQINVASRNPISGPELAGDHVAGLGHVLCSVVVNHPKLFGGSGSVQGHTGFDTRDSYGTVLETQPTKSSTAPRNATRGIFGWLRVNGYALDEQDIWKHEWFDMSESGEELEEQREDSS
ncbi:uncharacterized protein P884DRAFT_266466 [Thermothelomyces heterothallicus CBS 202.75]|uniref:uncharacterized protein n=1 Tax=Thermothelomyces heterothallicus CBS 202.75 TaxID=1149848 RepID=UPI003742E452